MDLHIQTPLIRSTPLCNQFDKQIYFKMECYQPIGSFKIRGIGQLCKRADAGYRRAVRGVFEGASAVALGTHCGGEPGAQSAGTGERLLRH